MGAAAEAAKASSNHDQEAVITAPPGLLADKTKDNPNQVQDSTTNVQETPITSTDLTITASVATVAKQQNGGNEKVDNIPAVTDMMIQNNTSEMMTKTIENVEGSDPNDAGSTKGGLTSEERVLLREKKKARLQKEQEQTTCQNNQNPVDSSLDGCTDPNDGHASSIVEGSDAEGEPGSGDPKVRPRTRSGRPIGNHDNNADNNLQTPMDD